MRLEIPVHTRNMLEIRCSFCNENMRQDIDPNPSTITDNTAYHFRNKAVAAKWEVCQTHDEYVLTLCPTHAAIIKDAGLI